MTHKLRDDAVDIWKAGVAAVDSRGLVTEHVRILDNALQIGDLQFPTSTIRHVVVVGAGKAGTGMTRGLLDALGSEIVCDKHVQGWVNVPSDCLPDESLPVHLHAGRPAGRNEPTEEGVRGALAMVDFVRSCHPDDMVICLLSGGGSALMPLPTSGISLQDKLLVTRLLAASGADIRELNIVRQHLSAIKGGELRRACRARRLVTLTISDVLGDPREWIASGPTEPRTTSTAEAWEILCRYVPDRQAIPARVRAHLADNDAFRSMTPEVLQPASREAVEIYHHLVIGNNDTAVRAAAAHARHLGYDVEILPTDGHEPTAEQVGARLLRVAQERQRQVGAWCVINGGEPTVKLVPESDRGHGGRNQQLIIAVLCELLRDMPESARDDSALGVRWAMLSAGTDGEDGPTDAAGAVLWNDLVETVRRRGPAPEMYLARNDAYSFFATCGGLLRVGPTHTNVCDLRVIVGRSDA